MHSEMRTSINHIEQYNGKYVLTDKPDGRIIAVSKNLRRAFSLAKKKGIPRPVVQFIEPKETVAIYATTLSV